MGLEHNLLLISFDLKVKLGYLFLVSPILVLHLIHLPQILIIQRNVHDLRRIGVLPGLVQPVVVGSIQRRLFECAIDVLAFDA